LARSIHRNHFGMRTGRLGSRRATTENPIAVKDHGAHAGIRVAAPIPSRSGAKGETHHLFVSFIVARTT